MVPTERGTPGRATVEGGQPAVEEKVADMENAARGFVGHIPHLVLFHMRMPLQEL